MKRSQAHEYPAFCAKTTARLIVAALAGSVAIGASARADAMRYVFATFKGDTAPGEALSIYTSTDATNFTLLADTGFTGTSGTLRDPSIMRYLDGRYYVAYTDPPSASCCGKEDHFSIASSVDLIHWTDLTTVSAGVPGVAHTWAPEWFVDGATVRIIANIDTLNNDTDFKPYVFTAQNTALTAWSGPVPLGVGPNYIDTFVIKNAGLYHAFTKNETTRYCEHATATSLTGPWTFVGLGNWAGWGSGMEGPNVVRLDDGSWKIFLDGQGAVGFLQATTTNLSVWSGTSPLPAISSLVRHGTVIRDEPVGSSAGDGGTVDAYIADATSGPTNDAADGRGGGAPGAGDAALTLDGRSSDTVGSAGAGGDGGAAGAGGPAGSSGTAGSQGGTATSPDGGDAGPRGQAAGCGCTAGGRPEQPGSAIGLLLLLVFTSGLAISRRESRASGSAGRRGATARRPPRPAAPA